MSDLERDIFAVLNQHFIRLSFIRNECRCGQRITFPHLRNWRKHVAAEVAQAVGQAGMSESSYNNTYSLPASGEAQ